MNFFIEFCFSSEVEVCKLKSSSINWMWNKNRIQISPETTYLDNIHTVSCMHFFIRLMSQDPAFFIRCSKKSNHEILNQWEDYFFYRENTHSHSPMECWTYSKEVLTIITSIDLLSVQRKSFLTNRMHVRTGIFPGHY